MEISETFFVWAGMFFETHVSRNLHVHVDLRRAVGIQWCCSRSRGKNQSSKELLPTAFQKQSCLIDRDHRAESTRRPETLRSLPHAFSVFPRVLYVCTSKRLMSAFGPSQTTRDGSVRAGPVGFGYQEQNPCSQRAHTHSFSVLSVFLPCPTLSHTACSDLGKRHSIWLRIHENQTVQSIFIW